MEPESLSRGNVKKDMHMYEKPPANQENVVSKLPPEIFKQVLSYLENENLETAHFVNTEWSKEVVTHIKNEDYQKSMAYVHFLISNLPAEAPDDVREKLIALIENKSILGAVSLSQIRSINFEYKEQLVKILKDLSKEDLTRLKSTASNEIAPELFKHIFQLALIYKSLDSSDIKDERLLESALSLKKYKFFDKALEVISRVIAPVYKVQLAMSMVGTLAAANKIDKALELVNDPSLDFEYLASIGMGVTKEEFTQNCFKAMSMNLFLSGKSEAAEEFFHKLNNNMKSEALQSVIAVLTPGGIEHRSLVLTPLNAEKSLPPILELLSTHYTQHPDSFEPSFDYNTYIQNLSKKFAETNPALAEKITSMVRK